MERYTDAMAQLGVKIDYAYELVIDYDIWCGFDTDEIKTVHGELAYTVEMVRSMLFLHDLLHDIPYVERVTNGLGDCPMYCLYSDNRQDLVNVITRFNEFLCDTAYEANDIKELETMRD